MMRCWALWRITRPDRPAQPADNQQQILEKQLEQAHRENALLTHKITIRDVLTDMKLQPGCNRAKKNERIEQALAMIAEVKKKYSLSNSEIARQLGLSYETLMRWRRRLSKGQPPVEKPGPKKIEPLDLGQLREKIRDLEHGAR